MRDGDGYADDTVQLVNVTWDNFSRARSERFMAPQAPRSLRLGPGSHATLTDRGQPERWNVLLGPC